MAQEKLWSREKSGCECYQPSPSLINTGCDNCSDLLFMRLLACSHSAEQGQDLLLLTSVLSLKTHRRGQESKFLLQCMLCGSHSTHSAAPTMGAAEPQSPGETSCCTYCPWNYLAEHVLWWFRLKPSEENPQYRLPVRYAEPHPDLHQLQSQEPVLWKLLHCSSPALQGRHRSLLLFLVQRTWQWDGVQWERTRPALSLPTSQAAQGQAVYQGHPLDAFKVIKALLKQQPITTTIIYTT